MKKPTLKTFNIDAFDVHGTNLRGHAFDFFGDKPIPNRFEILGKTNRIVTFEYKETTDEYHLYGVLYNKDEDLKHVRVTFVY